MAKILIIDDDLKIARLMDHMMTDLGHDTGYVLSLGDGRSRAAEMQPDVVLLDLTLPDGNGLTLLPDLLALGSEPEVIIVTGTGDQRGAEVAFKNGAWDYIAKPFRRDEVILSLSRALQYHEEKLASKKPLVLRRQGIVGSSSVLTACLEQVAAAAGTNASVLISGETGTGKELFARAIHQNSRRAEGGFVVVDCASLPESLVEGILFGHRKGAFTGADRDRAGLIKEADGGTLFLDEVGELPMVIQKNFLRVLQERRYRPVGGDREATSDFRLVAATNRDLDLMVKKGEFRSDLLFRLRTLELPLPPLRERREDVKELMVHFISDICETYGRQVKGYSPEFLESLVEYDWPGNIRELVNTLEGSLALAGDEPTLYPKHLPPQLRMLLLKNVPDQPVDASAFPDQGDDPELELPVFKEFRKKIVAEAERRYMKKLMSQAGGDIQAACEVSGLSQSRIYFLLKSHNIPVK